VLRTQIPEDQWEELAQRHANDESLRQLAKRYGVSHEAVRQALKKYGDEHA
jgi:TyrR family helix-turn-helix protein